MRLAGALELEAVTEGIETAEQAEALRQLHCPLGQAFHLARLAGPGRSRLAPRRARLPGAVLLGPGRVVTRTDVACANR